MNNNINIAELLKDCPKGMELYSPLCGKCVFDHLNMGTIICKKQNTQEIAFTSNGYYMLPVFDNCECMIFPSKEQRDWSKFSPFKDGDVLRDDCSVFIFKSRMFDNGLNCYVYNTPCILAPNKRLHVKPSGFNHVAGNVSFATEEEKEKLFKAIKDNGYKWNAETKSLEVLPKFKVGDRIERFGCRYTITEIRDNYYITKHGTNIRIDNQDGFELVPNKFDVTTLNPFDKVLVRYDNDNPWVAALFSHYIKDAEWELPYFASGTCFRQCVPYEGNQHLLGTTNDCDEYYKTWNDETDE